MNENVHIWLKGLIAAAAGGASGSLGLHVVSPDTAIDVLLKAGAINALIAVLMYLKQSPLP
jgi:hypothetical protein